MPSVLSDFGRCDHTIPRSWRRLRLFQSFHPSSLSITRMWIIPFKCIWWFNYLLWFRAIIIIYTLYNYNYFCLVGRDIGPSPFFLVAVRSSVAFVVPRSFLLFCRSSFSRYWSTSKLLLVIFSCCSPLR
jgi:hypothetical protein